jgi:hypothetical protein
MTTDQAIVTTITHTAAGLFLGMSAVLVGVIVRDLLTHSPSEGALKACDSLGTSRSPSITGRLRAFYSHARRPNRCAAEPGFPPFPLDPAPLPLISEEANSK